MNPELPPLTWDEYCWVGEIVLPSWRGFQTRRGPYAAVSSDEPSDGSVRLRLHGLGVLTHKNRVVEIGQADTAFDGNRAEEDSYG